MIAKGGFVHVVFALIKRIAIVDLGLSVEQIAAALKIDLKTIQKWIEQNPQG